jgi:ELWxxDGT repeat protein
LGDVLLLGAQLNASLGTELCAYGPWRPALGVYLLADINPGPAGSSPASITTFAGSAFFSAGTLVTGVELWRYDPGTGAVSLVADIFAGAESSYPAHLRLKSSRLLFAATSNLTGNEPYVFDPTAVPQVRCLVDIDTGNYTDSGELGIMGNDFEPQRVHAAG